MTTVKTNGAGEAAAPAFSLDVPVRFAETDAMGVVHHSVYISWLEAARVAGMDAVEMPYCEFAAGGHHFSVTGVRGEYRAPARFGDTVRVTATVRHPEVRRAVAALGADVVIDPEGFADAGPFDVVLELGFLHGRDALPGREVFSLLVD